MPDVSAERRIGLVVAEFDQHRDVFVPRREWMDSEFAESAAEVDQVLRVDVLIAEDQQLVFGERILDGVALFVRHRPAQVDARDFGAQVGTNPRDRDAGLLRDYGAALKAADRFIHDEAIPWCVSGARHRSVSSWVAGRGHAMSAKCQSPKSLDHFVGGGEYAQSLARGSQGSTFRGRPPSS